MCVCVCVSVCGCVCRVIDHYVGTASVNIGVCACSERGVNPLIYNIMDLYKCCFHCHSKGRLVNLCPFPVKKISLKSLICPFASQKIEIHRL